jgi:hypothetical protein
MAKAGFVLKHKLCSRVARADTINKALDWLMMDVDRDAALSHPTCGVD